MHDQAKQSLQQHLAAFEALCREKGLKLTHQRLEIYREILAAVDHPSVDALFQRVRQNIPSISLDTVYRTLAMLEEVGMIKRIQTVEGHARFESDQGVHHHLICRRCQKIEDFTWHEFDAVALPPSLENWGRIQARSIRIEGICSACLAPEK
jgi:Fur family peroxide stress response transcriptional regulator